MVHPVGRRGRRWVGLLLSLLLGVGMVGVAAPVASAEDTASMSIQISANVSSVNPGQTFEYTIAVECTAGTVNGCVNARVSDPLPRYISVDGIPTVSGNTTDPTIDAGPPVLITFNDDLGGGQIGLAPGNVIVITIPVKVDDDIPVDASGQPLVNTATITADNATAMTHDATVTPRRRADARRCASRRRATPPPSTSESGTSTTDERGRHLDDRGRRGRDRAAGRHHGRGAGGGADERARPSGGPSRHSGPDEHDLDRQDQHRRRRAGG